MRKNNHLDPIPEFDTLEEIADFWDEHSTADYDEQTYEVQFEVQLPKRQPIRLLPQLCDQLVELAQKRDISVETLVNVWLTEKLRDAA